MGSSPSATAPAKATIARTVTRIARAKASCPSVASRPARCGSSEVCIDLEELQRRAGDEQRVEDDAGQAVVAVTLTVSTAAFSSVCSASWIAATAQAKPAPARSVSAASAPARRLERAPRAGASAHGTTSSEATGAARIPSATAVWPRREADGDGHREAEARDRLEEHEPAVEARTTGVRRGSRARSTTPRRRAWRRRGSSTAWPSLERVLDRPAQRERDDEEGDREAACTSSGTRSGCPPWQPARAAVGDRARQQLLDRPVDDRDDDEQHRPQQRDRAVLAGGQHVAGDAKYANVKMPVAAIPIDRIRAPRP